MHAAGAPGQAIVIMRPNFALAIAASKWKNRDTQDCDDTISQIPPNMGTAPIPSVG